MLELSRKVNVGEIDPCDPFFLPSHTGRRFRLLLYLTSLHPPCYINGCSSLRTLTSFRRSQGFDSCYYPKPTRLGNHLYRGADTCSLCWVLGSSDVVDSQKENQITSAVMPSVVLSLSAATISVYSHSFSGPKERARLFSC